MYFLNSTKIMKYQIQKHRVRERKEISLTISIYSMITIYLYIGIKYLLYPYVLSI